MPYLAANFVGSPGAARMQTMEFHAEEQVAGPTTKGDVSTPTTITGKKPSQPKRIKRPMNAFMVWSSVERKKLAEKQPRLHNTELSKQLGRMWKAMTELEKLPFRKEADKLKSKLMEEHPDYKYKPKRKKIAANNCNTLWGNMKVHHVKSTTNQPNSDTRAITTTSTSCSSLGLFPPQSMPRTVWNGHVYPAHNSVYYSAKKCMHPSCGSTIHTHHTPIEVHLSLNTYTTNGYKPGETSSGVIQSLNTVGITPTLTDADKIYKKYIKKESNLDSEFFHFPLETPPCSPHTAPHSALSYPMDDQESAGCESI